MLQLRVRLQELQDLRIRQLLLLASFGFSCGAPVKDPLKDPFIKDPFIKDPLRDPLKDPLRDPLRDPVKEPLKETLKDP